MDMEWTKEMARTLIDHYHERRLLWDASNPYYNHKDKRNEALEQISASMNVDKQEIAKKFRNLQCHFLRELRKEKNGRLMDGEIRSYKSKWFGYKAMTFLVDSKKDKNNYCAVQDPQATNLEIDRTSNSETDDLADNSYCSPSTSNALLVNNYHQTEKRKSNYEISQPEIKKSKIISENRDNNNQIPKMPPSLAMEDGVVMEAYSIMKRVYDERSRRDEFSVFGEYVASQMCQLTTKNAQITAQHLINTTLYEARLGKYDQLLTTSSVANQQETGGSTPDWDEWMSQSMDEET